MSIKNFVYVKVENNEDDCFQEQTFYCDFCKNSNCQPKGKCPVFQQITADNPSAKHTISADNVTIFIPCATGRDYTQTARNIKQTLNNWHQKTR